MAYTKNDCELWLSCFSPSFFSGMAQKFLLIGGNLISLLDTILSYLFFMCQSVGFGGRLCQFSSVFTRGMSVGNSLITHCTFSLWHFYVKSISSVIWINMFNSPTRYHTCFILHFFLRLSLSLLMIYLYKGSTLLVRYTIDY